MVVYSPPRRSLFETVQLEESFDKEIFTKHNQQTLSYTTDQSRKKNMQKKLNSHTYTKNELPKKIWLRVTEKKKATVKKIEKYTVTKYLK